MNFDSKMNSDPAPWRLILRQTRVAFSIGVFLSGGSTATAGEVTFEYTGDYQTWVIPSGVTEINVDARGAQGGDGPNGGTGGLGGRVLSTLAVTPGQTLYFLVGGGGTRPAGGWNGGGDGGFGTNGGHGGGGGGASEIRIGGLGLSEAERVLVAGGGGGAGADVTVAGAGGGLDGGFEIPAGGNGGGGGTQTGGGAAGSGLSCQGNAGAFFQGGAGGSGCNGATGGGGGGYWGGGGAGSSEHGGGGSSKVPAGGSTTSGFQSGDGQIIINYGCAGSSQRLLFEDFSNWNVNGWTAVNGSNLQSDARNDTLFMSQTGGLAADPNDGQNARINVPLALQNEIVITGRFTPHHAGPGGGAMAARVSVRSTGTEGSGLSLNSNTGCTAPGSCGSSVPAEGCRQSDGFGLLFSTDTLDLGAGGLVRIQDSGLDMASVAYAFTNDIPYDFEMGIDEENHVEVRVWAASGNRPATATLSFDNGGIAYTPAANGSLLQVEVQNTNDNCGASHTIGATWETLLVSQTGCFSDICGDDILDAGEACDDGNITAGDCCSATCEIEVAGTVCRASASICDAIETCDGGASSCPADALLSDGAACNDGNPCTTGSVCAVGTCGGGSTTVCGPCEACTGAGGCATAPREDCKHVAAACDSRLKLFDNVANPRDSLDWQWEKGERTTLDEFDDPTSSATGSDYAVCMFGGTTGSPSVLLSAEVPAGEGWRRIGSGGLRGFQWKGRSSATTDGLTRIDLRPGVEGRASVRVQGKGDDLAMPGEEDGSTALPFLGATRLQLQASGGACWEAGFNDDCRTSRNDSGLFFGMGD